MSEKWTKRRVEARIDLLKAMTETLSKQAEDYKTRAEQAEAEVARLRGVLERIATVVDREHDPANAANEAMTLARAALDTEA